MIKQDNKPVLPPLADLHQLLSLTDLDNALNTVADEINERFDSKPITLLTVMNGGLVTAGYLVPKLTGDVRLDYIHVSRYREQINGADLDWKHFPESPLEDQIVLLVDDIFDEGVTLAGVKAYCESQGAQEVISVVLLTKDLVKRKVSMTPDYVALSIPNVYVFGFGLDYYGQGRNLPGIYCLKKDKE